MGGFVFILDFYAFSEEYFIGLDIKMCYRTPPMPQEPIPCPTPSPRSSCTSNQFRTVSKSCFIRKIMYRLHLMFECQKLSNRLGRVKRREGKKIKTWRIFLEKLPSGRQKDTTVFSMI